MTNAPGPTTPIGPYLAPAPKDLVSTGLGASRLWATVGQGIVTEVYWPTVGEPQTRDLGYFVAGDADGGWFSEVKAVRSYDVHRDDPAVPLARVVHRGAAAHPYTLTLEPVPDPDRDVLLVRHALRCDDPTAAVYPFLASHLHRHPARDADKDYSGGADNWAWSDDAARLYAHGADRFLCLRAAPAFTRTSVGFFGVSDLWHDFAAHHRMTWTYTQAGPGFVVLAGRCPAEGVVALSFAEDAADAAELAETSLGDGVEAARRKATEKWQAWAAGTTVPAEAVGDPGGLADAVRQSAAVIRAHEDVAHPGAIVAGLCVPWGDTSNNPGGYHLVWPRDCTEAALALLALGRTDDALRVLDYLARQQEEDGHWQQNFFPDGVPFWQGIQMDQTALPVLLAARLAEAGTELTDAHLTMIDRALSYIVRHGPLTEQDRWEEAPGGSPFTLGLQVAAMVAGVPYLPDAGTRDYVLALADDWNARIEEWSYVEGSQLDRVFGLRGHYVRVGPDPMTGTARIANQADRSFTVPSSGVLGMEFMYLARLGLRDPLDRRMTDSTRLVDIMLARNVGTGIAYYRYNYDGYGEQVNGANWNGVGVGRVWPLLAGERGHYAVLAGAGGSAQLEAMLAMRSPSGLLPEQVWDQPPLVPRDGVPSLPLDIGARTLSALPLVWAHAELIKLAQLRATGVPVERLWAVTDRYGARIPVPVTAYWRTAVPLVTVPRDTDLVVEDGTPFTLHYGHDGWKDVADLASAPLGLGMHGARLTARQICDWAAVDFRRRYPDGSWDPIGDQHVRLAAERLTCLQGHSG